MSAPGPRVIHAVRLTLGLNALFGASLCWAAGPAGIKLDGTLGGAAAVLAGPNYNITQGLGKLSGNNLFYSFQYFNVATGETALFSTSSPGISNVISRVTGGFASSIDGTISLQAASGAPNFFFINPSGVTFTSHALVDVPAAFYVSTANYLKFPDGNFYADPSQHSTLSAAAPEAFGFLGSTRASVELQGATLLGGNQGTSELQITAGDVSIDGGGGAQPTGLVNASGGIRVNAVGSATTEVPLSGPYAATDGTVEIRNDGIIAVQASAGAGIEVNAGNLVIDGLGATGTGIFSLVGPTGTAGLINLEIGHDAVLIDGGGIFTTTNAAGNGGEIFLSAQSLTIGNLPGVAISSGIFSLTPAQSSGSSGSIDLQLGSLTMNGGGAGLALISSETSAQSLGAGGNILVNVAGEALIANGSIITSATSGSGKAGDILVNAGDVVIAGETAAALIQTNSRTSTSGPAGSVLVEGGSLTIDGGYLPFFSGITSDTASNVSSPTVGSVGVAVTGPVAIYNGGGISASTSSAQPGGAVLLSAASLLIEGDGYVQPQANSNANPSRGTGVFSTATAGGSAAGVDIEVGALSIAEGKGSGFAGISADASASGGAGSILVHATTLTLDGAGSPDAATEITATTHSAGKAGDIAVIVAGDAFIENGAGIASATLSGTGDAGEVGLQSTTGKIEILNGGFISSISNGSSGNAGNVAVSANDLLIQGQGATVPTEITSTAFSAQSGHAGTVVVGVGTLEIDGSGSQLPQVGINSDSNSTARDASRGNVTVNVSGAATIANGGAITADTGGANDAGSIQITAGSLGLSGQFTKISTDAIAGSSGSAGDVTVTVGGDTTIQNLAGITSAALGTGNAGQVSLQGTGDVDILNGGFISSISNGLSGNAGNVSIGADELLIQNQSATTPTEITSSAFTSSSGSAGTITVSVTSLQIDGSGAHAAQVGINSDTNSTVAGTAIGNIFVNVTGAAEIVNGGTITTNTTGMQAGGEVKFTAGSLLISGQGYSPAGPNGHGTGIVSDANGSGDAGNLIIKAGSLSIAEGDGKGFAGIQAQTTAAGNGGQIMITVAGAASVMDAGEIRANSNNTAQGNAGSIDISAGSLLLDSMGNRFGETEIAATTAGTGAAGTINITTGKLQLADSVISIANNSTAANASTPGLSQITIDAQQIYMNVGFINASSTGNAPAAAIDIHYNSLLRMDPSEIATTAVNGNGGPITITGNGPLIVDQSAITTSVSGTTNGNGGNITIAVPVVVLDTGAIQANTTAPLANGGKVVINAEALIPSFESFKSGGDTPIPFDPTVDGLNVAQAAAPDGISGTLSGTAPQLDLGNSLLALTGRPAPPTALGRSLCGYTRGSSLAVAGRGGAPVSAYDPLWIDPSDATRTAQGLGGTPADAGARIERVALLGSIACR